jgi:hypothetical protein
MSAAALRRLPAGALADRYPLKPLMVVPDLVRAAAMLWIVIVIFAGRVTLAQLLVVPAGVRRLSTRWTSVILASTSVNDRIRHECKETRVRNLEEVALQRKAALRS